MLNIKGAILKTESPWGADCKQEDETIAWTKAEAEAWRLHQSTVSLWGVIGVQALTMLALTVAAWWLLGFGSVAKSVAYGGICVVFPSAMFVHGVRAGKTAAQAQSRMARFVVWELAKILLTVVMLVLAPNVVENVNWLALLACFVVTIKVYWFALWMQSRRGKSKFVRN